MTFTIAFAGFRIKNNVVLPEFAEMQVFIKPGAFMVWQACKVHIKVLMKVSWQKKVCLHSPQINITK